MLAKKWIVLLCICLGLLSARAYTQMVSVDCLSYCGELHRAIIDHTADSPYRYRVLSASLVAPFAPANTNAQIAAAYIVGHYLALVIMMLTLYAWFRCFTTQIGALIGVGIVALYLPLMFEIWGVSLYSIVEICFLASGLALIYHRPHLLLWGALLGALIFFATLNRETAILLPLAYITTHRRAWHEPYFWGWSIALLAIWAGVYLSLHLALGSAPNPYSIASVWKTNTTGGWWVTEAIGKLPLFLPIAISYALAIRRAPAFLRQLIPVLSFYGLIYLLFGFWHEVRLLLPALVLMLPACLILLETRWGVARSPTYDAAQ